MFGKTRHIHIIGIGGAGLSGITEILLDLGFRVTGSDIQKSYTTEHLRSRGATIYYGHAASQMCGADVVVMSPAIPPDNPELLAAEACREAFNDLASAKNQLIAQAQIAHFDVLFFGSICIGFVL